MFFKKFKIVIKCYFKISFYFYLTNLYDPIPVVLLDLKKMVKNNLEEANDNVIIITLLLFAFIVDC